ncbi:FG-GAP-like repeat-containing protein [Pelagicoccus sp. SDUM812003]|uniref:FG-GAP-like repeat-containing protein n=1 Tax=Pelagicoccus sp. SDUM812003 TaxID=3041267 RepID=UPI00280E3576|nr:FG-GAP-like repeat-containing protein [Pelagicoccus sp. SDUM812003]MDQ8205008.1 FG-GAP-like repeat-containing protein [Pelagicoccus sp. SDUM812003]
METDGFVAVPFDARSDSVESKTLFSELSPEQTGIVAPNAYDDPEMWRSRYKEFTQGPLGTGVALGDYDADGLLDVFIVCKTGPNRLFRNLGDWRFEDVTDEAGVAGPGDAWKTGVCFVDVNNDGWLDLYVCRVAAPNLLYLNQGDGRFVEDAKGAGLGLVDASGMAAFADYDRDGWLDVYIVTNLVDVASEPDGQPDYLYRNRGDGTFEEVTEIAGMSGKAAGHAAVWWDHDNDGWPDLYVTNDYGWPDQLWRNQGDGTFRDVLSEVMPHIPWYSMGADLGDVNNDGLLDFLVADMMPRDREWDQRTLIAPRSRMVDPVDPNVAPQYMRNTLFINTDTGRFLDAAWLSGLAATDWTWSALFEDLDEDGLLDLHVTNGTIRTFWDFDMRRASRVDGAMIVRRRLMASPVQKERNLAFRNVGDLRFEETGAAWGLDRKDASFGAAFGDLDGDGDLDLVHSNFEGNPSVYRNNGTEGNRVIIDLKGSASNRFGVGATIRLESSKGTQVRQIASARGYASSGETAAHFGLGADELIARLQIDWPSGQSQVFENLAPNQRYTIEEPEGASRPVPPWKAQPPRTQFVEVSQALKLDVSQQEQDIDELATQRLLSMRQNSLGPGMAIGDLNGDRIDDLVIGGTSTEGATVLLSQSGGRYVETPLRSIHSRAAVADAAPLLLDADGDGDLDLMLAKGGVAEPAGSNAYQPELWLNSAGKGSFRRAVDGWAPVYPESAGPVVAADYNRDGLLDVFIGGRVVPGAYPKIPRSALWENKRGRFVDRANAIAPGLERAGLVQGALWSDVDGDGWIDLLVATTWGTVRCWRNLAGLRFEEVTAELGFDKRTGWWTSIAAGDFNSDGRLDYAVGNLGLNTPYQASPEEPLVAFSGVFDDTGEQHFIEAVWDDGELYPRRNRIIMSMAMPWIFDKTDTFKAYAEAALDELLPEDALEQARRLQAVELRSGVFLSGDAGLFEFHPLPTLAQLAPVHGLIVGDFNADGRDDICLTQNTYAPIPENGRFSGGLGALLYGDGKGGFDAAPYKKSGYVVPGDARALAPIDLDRDGWPELFATRHQDASLLFGNTGVQGRVPMCVTLKGPPGNPTAVGAIVILELQNGERSFREVHAGGGYMSQGSGACYFASSSDNPPKRIIVRWPSGEVRSIDNPPLGGIISLSAR